MHFKKNLLLVLILLSIANFSCVDKATSTTSPKSTDEIIETDAGPFKKYFHKKGKYSLLVPIDWKINKKKQDGCAFISKRENDTDSFKEFLDIYVKEGRYIKNTAGVMEAENLSSAVWLERHFEVLRYGDPSIVVKESGSLMINGERAFFRSFIKEKDNVTYETVIYLLSSNNKAYIITLILDETKKTFYEPKFSEMIRSLKF